MNFTARKNKNKSPEIRFSVPRDKLFSTALIAPQGRILIPNPERAQGQKTLEDGMTNDGAQNSNAPLLVP